MPTTCIRIAEVHVKTFRHLPPCVQSWIYHRINDAEVLNEPASTGPVRVDFERSVDVTFVKRSAHAGEFGPLHELPYMAVADVTGISWKAR